MSELSVSPARVYCRTFLRSGAVSWEALDPEKVVVRSYRCLVFIILMAVLSCVEFKFDAVRDPISSPDLVLSGWANVSI